MKTSETIKTIAPALLKAQKLIGGATKGAANPFFKSKYADYGAVLEACKDHLNENGIMILQPHTANERGSFVETILIHESGEWVSSETQVICAKQNDPQALGSAITYARRYGLQSLLAMPAEDDDGESAMVRGSKATTAAKPTPVTTKVAVDTVAMASEASAPVEPTEVPKKKVGFRPKSETTTPAASGGTDNWN